MFAALTTQLVDTDGQRERPTHSHNRCKSTCLASKLTTEDSENAAHPALKIDRSTANGFGANNSSNAIYSIRS